MDLTAANTDISLSIAGIFPIPQQLQGFATDDVFDVGAIESVETMMGVDGVLSGGFVYKEIEMEISLQADSASLSVFDVWWTQMVATQQTYTANGLIRLPSVKTKFVMTRGFLKSYKAAPQGRRILQPRKFRIGWQMIAPQPTA